MEIAFNNPEY